MYKERFYRGGQGRDKNMRCFEVSVGETDLWIAVDRSSYSSDLEEFVKEQVQSLRRELEEYIVRDPEFKTALVPHRVMPGAPLAAVDMARAADLAGVGPMAGVAGMFARETGSLILARTGCRKLIVENGGDIYLAGSGSVTLSIFAGQSPLSERVGIRLNVRDRMGVCTSSGTVGHSLSFGRADAVVVVSRDAVIADVFATSLCNRVQEPEDVAPTLEAAKLAEDVTGAVVILGKSIGAWGEIELVNLSA